MIGGNGNRFGHRYRRVRNCGVILPDVAVACQQPTIGRVFIAFPVCFSLKREVDRRAMPTKTQRYTPKSLGKCARYCSFILLLLDLPRSAGFPIVFIILTASGFD
jgi:hypothetical protein